MYVFVCHDDPDSIFTAIYDAWASRLGHKNIRILAKEPENYELFCEYIHVTTDAEKSRKVADTIRRRLGAAASPVLFQAIMADESGIAGSGRRSSSSSFPLQRRTRSTARCCSPSPWSIRIASSSVSAIPTFSICLNFQEVYKTKRTTCSAFCALKNCAPASCFLRSTRKMMSSQSWGNTFVTGCRRKIL